MDPDTAQTAAALIGTLIAVMSFIGLIVGWAIRNWMAVRLGKMEALLNRIVNEVLPQGQPALSDQVQDLRGSMAALKREVLPNGGSSLKDRVVRIEAKLDAKQ